MEAHRIQFGIGLLTNESENLFGVGAHCSPARRGYLLGKLDNPIGSRDRIKAAALHVVEGCRKGIEGLPIQLALLGRHLFGDSLESGGRLGWPASSHVAGNSQNDIDAKRLQLRTVD